MCNKCPKCDSVVHAGERIASALRLLGNADAGTPMGAVEAHGQAVLEAAEKIAMCSVTDDSVRDAGDDIATAGREIADALRDVASAIRETQR